MVRLEGRGCAVLLRGKSGFNSTMVRLEDHIKIILIAVFHEFQFHDGAIRRILLFFASRTGNSFNSTMVRLEVVKHTIPDVVISFQFHDGAIRRKLTNGAWEK